MSDATPSGTSSLQCAECDQPITAGELSQGLAVRVDGRLVCPMCVDALPGEAQVRINQFRALRGLNVTTYRVPRPGRPRLNAYTFTTAAHITLHRRELHETGTFEAPLLPPPRPVESAEPTPPQPTAATRMRPAPAPLAKHFPLIAVAVAVVLVGVIVLTSGPAPKPPPRSEAVAGGGTTPPPADPPPPVAETRTRASFDIDAQRAWKEASGDRACPPALLQAIADEIVDLRSKQLDGAVVALGAGDLPEANRLLEAMTVPEHVFFRAIHTRQAEVAALRLAAMQKPKPPDPAVALAGAPGAVPDPGIAKPPESAAPPGADPPIAIVAPAVDPPRPGEPLRPPPTGEQLLLLPELMVQAMHKEPWTCSDWQARLERGDRGVLDRSLRVGGGRYQLWMLARAPSKEAWIEALINEQRQDRITAEPGRKEHWIRIGPASHEFPAGNVRLRLVAHGRNWNIVRLYLLGSELPAPHDRDSGRSAALAWPKDQPVPGPRVINWEPRAGDAQAGGPIELNPFDDDARIPPARPINGSTRLFHSQPDARGRQRVVLDLGGASAVDGGIVVVVHPRRDDRTLLDLTLTDVAGRTWHLPGQSVQAGTWNVLTVRAQAPPGTIGFDKLKSLVVADGGPNPLTTPFLLGRVAVVSDGEPGELTNVRPGTLLIPGNKALDGLLSAIGGKRGRSGQWRREFNVDQVRFIAGNALVGGDAGHQLREGTTRIYGSERWYDNSVAGMPAEEAALAQFFAQQLMPERFHVAVCSLAGVDIPERRRELGPFRELCKAIIQACYSKGVLPVFCLGPLRGGDVPDPDDVKRWKEIEGMLTTPVIDLRGVVVADPARLTSEQARACNRAIIDGMVELVARVRYLQRTPGR